MLDTKEPAHYQRVLYPGLVALVVVFVFVDYVVVGVVVVVVCRCRSCPRCGYKGTDHHRDHVHLWRTP